MNLYLTSECDKTAMDEVSTRWKLPMLASFRRFVNDCQLIMFDVFFLSDGRMRMIR